MSSDTPAGLVRQLEPKPSYKVFSIIYFYGASKQENDPKGCTKLELRTSSNLTDEHAGWYSEGSRQNHGTNRWKKGREIRLLSMIDPRAAG